MQEPERVILAIFNTSLTNTWEIYYIMLDSKNHRMR